MALPPKPGSRGVMKKCESAEDRSGYVKVHCMCFVCVCVMCVYVCVCVYVWYVYISDATI